MACSQVDRLLLIQTVLYFVIVTTGLATSISSALTRVRVLVLNRPRVLVGVLHLYKICLQFVDIDHKGCTL